MDHIVPIAYGGQHVVENLMIVHSDINQLKGTASLDFVVGLCCAVADHCKSRGIDIEDAARRWRQANNRTTDPEHDEVESRVNEKDFLNN